MPEDDLPDPPVAPDPPAPPEPPPLPEVEPIEPATASLEWLCEEVIIRMMKCDERLAPLEMRHHGEATSAALNLFVVKAERGFHRLDGMCGFDLMIFVTFATDSMMPRDLDHVAAATVDAVYTQQDALDVHDIPLLGFIVEDGSTTKRDDGEKTRRRVVSIPVISDRAPFQ